MLLYYLLFASGNNITWVIEDAYQMYHILNIAMTRRMTTLLSAWSKYNIKKRDGSTLLFQGTMEMGGCMCMRGHIPFSLFFLMNGCKIR